MLCLYYARTTVLAEVQDTYEDVRRLEASILELHRMFMDLALLVEQQGETLDVIEFQMHGLTLITARNTITRMRCIICGCAICASAAVHTSSTFSTVAMCSYVLQCNCNRSSKLVTMCGKETPVLRNSQSHTVIVFVKAQLQLRFVTTVAENLYCAPSNSSSAWQYHALTYCVLMLAQCSHFVTVCERCNIARKRSH
eukprot:3425-Heterococcus_DN1.PRE.1